jgi:peptide/nickel transport system permease protein
MNYFKRQIINRLVFMIPTLLGVTVATFLMLYLMPGNPASILLGPDATPEAIQQMEKFLGLNQPLYIQYFTYMSNLLNGGWGRSVVTGRDVLPMLATRFLNTAELAIVSMIISTSVGIIVGVLTAVRHKSRFDAVIMGATVMTNSTPVFVVATILIYVFSIRLGLFPSMGNNQWYSVVLPALALSGWLTANIARVTRTNMIEILGQDYIRTMRAMGVKSSKVVFDYALKNALVPIVTVIGTYFGYAMGGAVLTETVFNWPGIGSLIVQSIFARDFPVIRGGILLVGVAFVAVNLVTDLVASYIDPRIRSK